MENKPKIGITLCGGGLQGFSHIGAIMALEELGINPEYISGTSTGSVVTVLYALGYTPGEIIKICEENYTKILKVNKSLIIKMGFNFFRYKDTKTEGLLDGSLVSDFISEYASKKNIKKISDIKNKKVAITTVDTKTMKECIFVSNDINSNDEDVDYISDISIGDAVRSSMAFPGIFTPVNYKDYSFIDGGTVDNLPVGALKEMGADKVISVSLDLYKYTPSPNMEGVLLRALDIFSLPSVKRGRSLADVNIIVYNPDTSLLSIKNMEKTVENGYNAVMSKKEEILKI